MSVQVFLVGEREYTHCFLDNIISVGAVCSFEREKRSRNTASNPGNFFVQLLFCGMMHFPPDNVNHHSSLDNKPAHGGGAGSGHWLHHSLSLLSFTQEGSTRSWVLPASTALWRPDSASIFLRPWLPAQTRGSAACGQGQIAYGLGGATWPYMAHQEVEFGITPIHITYGMEPWWIEPLP